MLQTPLTGIYSTLPDSIKIAQVMLFIFPFLTMTGAELPPPSGTQATPVEKFLPQLNIRAGNHSMMSKDSKLQNDNASLLPPVIRTVLKRKY